MASQYVQEIFRRLDDMFGAVQAGLDDLCGSDRNRRMNGLRALITSGRSVTWILQNLRSKVAGFDSWYEPEQARMKANPLMRFFVETRNELVKQGKLDVGTRTYIKSFSSNDIGTRFGPRPAGATGFFMGDNVGGTGWLIRDAEGSERKIYVDLPADIGEVTQTFANMAHASHESMRGESTENLSRRYLDELGALIDRAKGRFL